MKELYFFYVCFFSFFVTFHAEETSKSGCLEKEKALALLETVEDLLSKAKINLPSCKNGSITTNQSECGETKSLAYIEISEKLISDIRKNFPTCPKIITHIDKPTDCTEILASGRNESGVYTVWPRESNTTERKLQVYCDMKTDGGGWTMIQRRGKFPDQQDFYQNWESYKKGFGNITKEFWLGNENIRILCHKGCAIRFDLQSQNGTKRFALYDKFSLSGSNYNISISNYTGDSGNAMQHHNNLEFSTKDRGDTKRAQEQKGGWWYGAYYNCNPNGIYQPGTDDKDSVHWWNWLKYENLASVEIKVRRN